MIFWRFIVGATVTVASLAGCNNAEEESSKEPTRQENKEIAKGDGKTTVPMPRPEGYARLHQPFVHAIRAEPPEDQRPPDLTRTGKSVGKIYKQVVASWDSIRFMNGDGSRIHYVAIVETELGTIWIALDADAAPNHVRSFIALARAGFYDGLTFDRIYHEETTSDMESKYEEISAGCPLGIGDPASNNVGYWLRPEFNNRLTHEEGTVGACRAIEEDTAACKFYISLSKAPYLDGNFSAFGKVTRGIEVARKIYVKPVILEGADTNPSRRPLQPVVIRKVTIQERTN